jgi:protoporphyrinogen/coproporphyrinogen III oxidase
MQTVNSPLRQENGADSSPNNPVIIIGGGISGLTAAHWLKKERIGVLVLEKQAEPGGTMQTLREDGWLIETGPNSALETTPLFKGLFNDLSLGQELLYADPKAKKRYILRDNTLHALPMGAGSFLSSGLWSMGGKLRLLREPFIGRAEKEESIAEFVERRLGREFLDYAINPFVAGVFAGDPTKLSVRSAFPKLYALEEKYGGLIKGMIKGSRERKARGEVAKDRAEMFSFRSGMQAFPNALAASLGDSLKLDCSIERVIPVQKGDQRLYNIVYREGGVQQTIEASVVVFATPAYVTSTILGEFKTDLPTVLNDIYYPPVAEVFMGFRRKQVRRPLDGFGLLVPEIERRKFLGTIWSSVIFPGRTPDASTEAFTSFVGGSRQPELVNESDQRLTQIVLDELRGILQLEGNPIFTKIRRWDRAIPQYRMGYQSVVNAMEKFQQQNPGLYICSNYKGGISVGDCVMSADRVVGEILKQKQIISR